ncbi:MAG: murein biosynthesis integral membrane protein MurJ, partial [Gammaproteobacteria bacterium]
NWRHPGVQRLLILMGPAIFGVSVAQLNFLISTLIASFLREGSISWLYFSDRLMEFPLGIFGVALGTVMLPSLAEYHARGQHRLFSDTLDWALRLILVITVPSAVGLAVLAGPMLSTLFQYGRMTEFDVIMSARSLVAYAFGLSGFIFVKVLAPAFFARQDVRTPVKIGVVALLSNLVLNLALVVPLQHAGLALATSLAAFINAWLLLRALTAQQIYVPQPGWSWFTAKVIVAAGVMSLVLVLLNAPTLLWSSWPWLTRALRLTGLIALGVAVYFGCCWSFGLRRRDVAQPTATI